MLADVTEVFQSLYYVALPEPYKISWQDQNLQTPEGKSNTKAHMQTMLGPKPSITRLDGSIDDAAIHDDY